MHIQKISPYRFGRRAVQISMDVFTTDRKPGTVWDGAADWCRDRVQLSIYRSVCARTLMSFGRDWKNEVTHEWLTWENMLGVYHFLANHWDSSVCLSWVIYQSTAVPTDSHTTCIKADIPPSQITATTPVWKPLRDEVRTCKGGWRGEAASLSPKQSFEIRKPPGCFLPWIFSHRRFQYRIRTRWRDCRSRLAWDGLWFPGGN